ncbi:MAG TPA: nitronate monooxygenase, partial [Trebonia sp.]|nr:nitronate monooxygenase [Trebonia sp.]
MNPLLRRLGIELPIVQAPMAGVSTPEMAAAVSNAGGLGSIGIGAADPEAARGMIRAVRALTDRPFNVNVFCHAPAVPDPGRESAWLARLAPEFARYGATPPGRLREIYTSFVTDAAMQSVLLGENPPAVSFHFGLPARGVIDAFRQAGVVLLATATSLHEGKVVAAAGIDAVVAQGYEAGGHRGVFDPAAPDDRLGTMALTRLLVKQLGVPVIAAGGIMDGAGIAAALALGAAAAQLGTAFVACPESSADAGFRAA